MLTVPWDNGTRVEDIIQSEDSVNFADWTYPGTGTPIMKARHPDYELFTADSTHYRAGVSCADCHMPYLRDGAMKYSSHDIMSPLLDPQQACGQCHTDVDIVLARVSVLQDTVHEAKIGTEDALIDAITAIKGAAANPSTPIQPCSTRRGPFTGTPSTCGTSFRQRTAWASTTPTKPCASCGMPPTWRARHR